MPKCCYHPRSCLVCDRLGRACGAHYVGEPGHERCTGVDTSSDELLPGCCTCCAAAIERGDQIGHSFSLLVCPCLPIEECTPIVEGFSDPDGSPAARLLIDLPHLGLASGSEWLLMGARR